ncbi:geranylgeranyl diphosphate reductase, chloroplastic [Trifolium repens]|nr:geranylgeranyl diphosphate reductase, chloroplastic [Trifolium repens]
MSTATLEGEIIFIFVTRRSMMSNGRSNSPTMQRGMAPPHGLQLSIFLSMRKVSTPPFASVSAAAPPAGPPPMTATRRFRPLSFWLFAAATTVNLRR